MSSTQPTTSANAPASSNGYKRQSTEATTTAYLKWTDSETKTLRVISPTATPRRTHWTGQLMIACPGANCQLCATGDRVKVRWLLQVSIDGSEQTWDLSNQTFAELENIAEIQGQLAGLNVRVRRNGTGRNTTYTMVPFAAPAAAIAAPAQQTGPKERIVDMCHKLSLDPKAELIEFLKDLRPDLAGAAPIVILAALEQHILTEHVPPSDDPAADAGTADLFDLTI